MVAGSLDKIIISMGKITKITTLGEILQTPNNEKILAKYSLPCLFCPMMKAEADFLTIGQICKIYNIDIKNLLKELNESKEKI